MRRSGSSWIKGRASVAGAKAFSASIGPHLNIISDLLLNASEFLSDTSAFSFPPSSLPRGIKCLVQMMTTPMTAARKKKKVLRQQSVYL